MQYQTYDIGPYLRQGENAVGVVLGPGWYKGRFLFEGGFTNIYGGLMQFIGEIRIRGRDGREQVFGSGTDWQGRASPVQSSGIYDGEVYSASAEVPRWPSPDCPAEGWRPALLTGRGVADLSARVNPPIVIHEWFKPQKIIHTSIGEWILDFGQEITGWVEVNLTKDVPGIRLSYSEIMQEGAFTGTICVPPRPNMSTSSAAP